MELYRKGDDAGAEGSPYTAMACRFSTVKMGKVEAM
jgi:hypothetical protein